MKSRSLATGLAQGAPPSMALPSHQRQTAPAPQYVMRPLLTGREEGGAVDTPRREAAHRTPPRLKYSFLERVSVNEIYPAI